jgi:hypothetical protein
MLDDVRPSINYKRIKLFFEFRISSNLLKEKRVMAAKGYLKS